MTDWVRLEKLRAGFLALGGDAAVEIHGWLLGVADLPGDC